MITLKISKYKFHLIMFKKNKKLIWYSDYRSSNPRILIRHFFLSPVEKKQESLSDERRCPPCHRPLSGPVMHGWWPLLQPSWLSITWRQQQTSSRLNDFRKFFLLLFLRLWFLRLSENRCFEFSTSLYHVTSKVATVEDRILKIVFDWIKRDNLPALFVKVC